MAWSNKDIALAIDRQRDTLPHQVLEMQFQRQPHLRWTYDEYQREKYLQDVAYHLSYLADSVAVSDPLLFVNYIDWAGVLLTGLGISMEDLAISLEILRDALLQALPEEIRDVPSEYIQLAVTRLQGGPAELPSLIDESMPLGVLARRYLDFLLLGERHAASGLILDSVAAGTSVKDIYLQVFQRTQHEIGRLWQTGRIGVAQEHYCTAATQLIMSQLYPYVFSSKKNGLSVVATCVGKELHEVGLRMIADFLEMEGWDTYYLGANMPVQGVLQAIAEHRARILAISATMTFHVRAVVELIEAVRASESGMKAKIIVGGHPFNLAPDLWEKVGADGYARDAAEAVWIVSRLVSLPNMG